MNCKEVLESLSDYVDDEVDPDIGDEIDVHLDGCTACKAFLNTLQRTVDFCRDTTVPPLPETEREGLRETAREAYMETIKGGKAR